LASIANLFPRHLLLDPENWISFAVASAVAVSLHTNALHRTVWQKSGVKKKRL